MADSPPKSAYELAMERLRQQDEDAGVDQLSLTDEQKAEIAEVRRVYDAKLAEQQIMHHDELRRTFDLAACAAMEEASRRERARLTAERDERIERIRSGNAKK